jgi:hypothetical protein
MFTHTASTKRKLSKMRKGARNPFFGKKHSDEAKAKMAAWTRRFNARRQYAIKDVDINLSFSAVQIGYLAAIIDGEGSIVHPRSNWQVVVYNCEVCLMKWLVAVVGGSYGVAHRNGREPNYAWRIGGARNVFQFLTIIRPALVIKGWRADYAMSALK